VRDGGEGEARWRRTGRPLVPTLVVAGVAMPVVHVSQIAEALGLPPPPGGSPVRDARDAAVILDAWLSHIGELEWETLLRPTPSRGRSLRNLTVNVFGPFELLPAAWTAGRFDWRPEEDGAREAEFEDRLALLRFAEGAAAGWRRLLVEIGDELARFDPSVVSPRGDVPFSTLLSFQRWHAAFHYRQLVEFLRPEETLDLAAFEDLDLPTEIF
jgi:hypothetical protein